MKKNPITIHNSNRTLGKFHHLKRKDTEILKPSKDLQKNIPKKAIKLAENKRKEPEKFIKPRIIWKNINKFNIKSKFNEIFNFLKAMFKNISGFLKENENKFIILNELKPKYIELYETLQTTNAIAKENREANEISKNILCLQINGLNSEKNDLKTRIHEIRLKKQLFSEKINEKNQEFQELTTKKSMISASLAQLKEQNNELKEKVEFLENKKKKSEVNIAQIQKDLKKECENVEDLRAKVLKKKKKIYGESFSSDVDNGYFENISVFDSIVNEKNQSF